jgi:hypothetical protein
LHCALIIVHDSKARGVCWALWAPRLLGLWQAVLRLEGWCSLLARCHSKGRRCSLLARCHSKGRRRRLLEATAVGSQQVPGQNLRPCRAEGVPACAGATAAAAAAATSIGAAAAGAASATTMPAATAGAAAVLKHPKPPLKHAATPMARLQIRRAAAKNDA